MNNDINKQITERLLLDYEIKTDVHDLYYDTVSGLNHDDVDPNFSIANRQYCDFLEIRFNDIFGRILILPGDSTSGFWTQFGGVVTSYMDGYVTQNMAAFEKFDSKTFAAAYPKHDFAAHGYSDTLNGVPGMDLGQWVFMTAYLGSPQSTKTRRNFLHFLSCNSPDRWFAEEHRLRSKPLESHRWHIFLHMLYANVMDRRTCNVALDYYLEVGNTRALIYYLWANKPLEDMQVNAAPAPPAPAAPAPQLSLMDAMADFSIFASGIPSAAPSLVNQQSQAASHGFPTPPEALTRGFGKSVPLQHGQGKAPPQNPVKAPLTITPKKLPPPPKSSPAQPAPSASA